MELDAAADDPGAEDIVGGSDDAGSESGDDGGFPPRPGDSERNGDGNPDGGRADDRDHGAEPGDDAPEDWGMDAGKEKEQPGERSLDDGYRTDAVDIGQDAFADFGYQAIEDAGRQGKELPGAFQKMVSVAKQEKENEEGDDAIEQKDGDIAENALDETEESAADAADAFGKEGVQLVLGGGRVQAEVDEGTAAVFGEPFRPTAAGVTAGFQRGVEAREFAGYGGDEPDGGQDDQGYDEEKGQRGGQAFLARHAAQERNMDGIKKDGEGRCGDDGAQEGLDDHVTEGEGRDGKGDEEELLQMGTVEHRTTGANSRNQTGARSSECK